MVCFHRQNPPNPTPTLGCFVKCCFVNLQSQTQLSVSNMASALPLMLFAGSFVWQANGLWCYCCFGCHTLWGIVLVFIIVPIRWVDGDLPCLLLVRMAGNCTYARQRSCKLSFRLGIRNHRITSLRLFVDQYRSLTLFSFPNFVFKVALLGFIRLRTKIASRMTLITKF